MVYRQAQDNFGYASFRAIFGYGDSVTNFFIKPGNVGYYPDEAVSLRYTHQSMLGMVLEFIAILTILNWVVILNPALHQGLMDFT